MKTTTLAAQGKDHGLLPDGPMETASTYLPDSRDKDNEKSAETSRDYELHLVRNFRTELLYF